ncbi:MAG: glycosyltransferase family 9 protein [Brevinematales bacterium]|nr:glycosyltransferase family 9 protein [Brevinematales bacterium]
MKRILISPMYGMGDTLLTTPALRILKENKPDFCIECITFQKTSYDLLKENPNIDNLICYPFLKKSKIESLIYILKNITWKYDAVINFYPSNRIDYNIFSFLTQAKIRIGHTYLKSNFSQLNWLKNRTIKENYYLHCVEENIKLLEFLGIKSDKAPPMEVYLKDEEITSGKNYLQKISNRTIKIGIHTGTSSFKNHIHRRWPKEKFLEVVNSLEQFDFFLFGTKEEEEENKFIQKKSLHKNVYLIENKNIREVAAIIKQLNIFISNDSGLMHLAAAVGVPVVAIFGPTNPNWVKPWGVNHKVISLDLSCSPCFYYSPKPLKCYIKEKFKCIREIESNTVIKAILEILK